MSYINYPSIKRDHYHQESTYLPASSKVQMKGISSRFTYKPATEHHDSSQPSERFPYTKNSIHQALEMISTKKTKTKEAIEEIKSVNHEIASSLINSIKVSQYEYRSRTPDRCMDSPRDQTIKSQYQWRPIEQMNQNEDITPLYETLDLRSKLNEEMRINNELMRYVKTLQSENQRLRMRKASKPNMDQLLEENRQLKTKLALLQTSSQSHSHIHKDLYSELHSLKTDTQSLRTETRNFIKRRPY